MIKYWWSEDRQWFCIRIKGETVSLTVAEAEELMGEVQQTPSFLALQEEAYQRAVELMERSRTPANEQVEKTARDAPSWYSAEQADAWASGYNSAHGHSLYSNRENSIAAERCQDCGQELPLRYPCHEQGCTINCRF